MAEEEATPPQEDFQTPSRAGTSKEWETIVQKGVEEAAKNLGLGNRSRYAGGRDTGGGTGLGGSGGGSFGKESRELKAKIRGMAANFAFASKAAGQKGLAKDFLKLGKGVGSLSPAMVGLKIAVNAAIVGMVAFDKFKAEYQKGIRSSLGAVAAGGGAFKKGSIALADNLRVSSVALGKWNISVEQSQSMQRQLLQTRQAGISEAMGKAGFTDLMDKIENNLVSQTGLEPHVFTSLISEQLKMGLTNTKDVWGVLTEKDGPLGRLNALSEKLEVSFDGLLDQTITTQKSLRPLGLNMEDAGKRAAIFSQLVYQGVLTQQQSIGLMGGRAASASAQDLLRTAVLSGQDIGGGNLMETVSSLRMAMSGDIAGIEKMGTGQKNSILDTIRGEIAGARDMAGGAGASSGAVAEAAGLRGGALAGLSAAQARQVIERMEKGADLKDVFKGIKSKDEEARVLQQKWKDEQKTWIGDVTQSVSDVKAQLQNMAFGGDRKESNAKKDSIKGYLLASAVAPLTGNAPNVNDYIKSSPEEQGQLLKLVQDLVLAVAGYRRDETQRGANRGTKESTKDSGVHED